MPLVKVDQSHLQFLREGRDRPLRRLVTDDFLPAFRFTLSFVWWDTGGPRTVNSR